LNRNDAIRIHHMIDAGEAALRFVAGRQRADLDSDEMLRFALVRAVEIIGGVEGFARREERRVGSPVG
jgi:uncharacterized protein with HEPN domain